MDLSIIIVSFNTQELLAKCLSSVKQSAKNLNVEVFVVDNNSSDSSVDIVKSDYSWVKLFENRQNLGFSRANNQALKKAKGKYVLVLNPDTKLLPQTLTKMVKFMDSRLDVGIATCKVVLANSKLDKDCRRLFPTPWRAFCHFSGLSKLFTGSRIFDQYQMGYTSDRIEHEIDSCVGAFMMIRSSLLKKIGLFDEDFFFYGEDLDLCWRAKVDGFKIIYTPIAKIIHHKGAASGMKPSSKHLTSATRSSKHRAIQESTRAMELFYKKHYMDKYPFFITWPIILTIRVLSIIRLLVV